MAVIQLADLEAVKSDTDSKAREKKSASKKKTTTSGAKAGTKAAGTKKAAAKKAKTPASGTAKKSRAASTTKKGAPEKKKAAVFPPAKPGFFQRFMKQSSKNAAPGISVGQEVLLGTAELVRDSSKKIDAVASGVAVQKKAAVRIVRWMERLSAVLDNINQRLENTTDQGAGMLEMAAIIMERIAETGRVSRAEMEMLKHIGETLELQDKSTAEIGSKITELSGTIGRLNESTDHHTTESREDLHSIKNQLNGTVETLSASVARLEKRQDDFLKTHGNRTREILNSLESVQREQQEQIRMLSDRSRLTNWLISAVLVAVAAAGILLSL